LCDKLGTELEFRTTTELEFRTTTELEFRTTTELTLLNLKKNDKNHLFILSKSFFYDKFYKNFVSLKR
jgi:hypothetical protein